MFGQGHNSSWQNCKRLEHTTNCRVLFAGLDNFEAGPGSFARWLVDLTIVRMSYIVAAQALSLGIFQAD
ncbi:uncharacterized protein RSE6_11534 [Rhynchosporium secalis]|uniref:Uncharacterized protein n=1 Tax=Rhynchosporium secalis TaxID=38038 RepID=A0A1E1MN60_RHYSE|nr:uncharacterized protein RSE6_11534 [Rhynchosporium secalis]